MPMQSPMDLFLHELGDIYDAEQRIAQILPQLANESADPRIQDNYQAHLKETQQQIQNLEQVFQVLGTQPRREACAAIQGLKTEHDTFLNENPSQDMLTLFDLEAAAKTEHYEIASYTGLVEKCSLMGQPQCVQLLQQNLQQEQAMLQRVTRDSQQLGRQVIGQAGMDQTSQSSQGAEAGV